MDDSFSFCSTVPLRREFDPLAVKAAVFGMLVVLGIGLFANWVIRSERASFSRADRGSTASDVDAEPLDGSALVSNTGDEADEAIGIALDAARAALREHRTVLDAGPAQLSALQPGYTFVDGPSTTSRIVSVASTVDTWAAAVHGLDGMCHWIRATRAGDITRGMGSECTGTAALTVVAPR